MNENSIGPHSLKELIAHMEHTVEAEQDIFEQTIEADDLLSKIKSMERLLDYTKTFYFLKSLLE